MVEAKNAKKQHLVALSGALRDESQPRICPTTSEEAKTARKQANVASPFVQKWSFGALPLALTQLDVFSAFLVVSYGKTACCGTGAMARAAVSQRFAESSVGPFAFPITSFWLSG